MAEFKAWPSIPRLSREIVVTEKIDGANGAIHIEQIKFRDGQVTMQLNDVLEYVDGVFKVYRITAQSRNRLISTAEDAFGFARWVQDNATGLVETLGEGIHYGEWWGYKINRGYGLEKGDRRFSLFNTERWNHLDGTQVPGLHVVPVLGTGVLFRDSTSWGQGEDWVGSDDSDVLELATYKLQREGSYAAPGYKSPEGIVVFHTQGRLMFKYTLDGDGHKYETSHRHEPDLVEVEEDMEGADFCSVSGRSDDRSVIDWDDDLWEY